MTIIIFNTPIFSIANLSNDIDNNTRTEYRFLTSPTPLQIDIYKWQTLFFPVYVLVRNRCFRLCWYPDRFYGLLFEKNYFIKNIFR